MVNHMHRKRILQLVLQIHLMVLRIHLMVLRIHQMALRIHQMALLGHMVKRMVEDMVQGMVQGMVVAPDVVWRQCQDAQQASDPVVKRPNSEEGPMTAVVLDHEQAHKTACGRHDE